MKEKLKRFALLFAAHVIGVAVGTLLSAPLNGVTLDVDNYLGAILLAPVELTIGIPLVFNLYSTLAGVLVVSGLIASVAAFAWGMATRNLVPALVMVVGSILWSLGNIPVFCALMSV